MIFPSLEPKMTFCEALDLAINEQWAERIQSSIKSETFLNRTMLAMTSENFRIPVEVMRWIELPEGINFGTFNNCREYGITYKYNGWTFCLYEHRNSDNIILQGCPDADVEPYGPYGKDSDSKWDVLADFKFGQYENAAEALEYALKNVTPELSRAELKGMLARKGF